MSIMLYIGELLSGNPHTILNFIAWIIALSGVAVFYKWLYHEIYPIPTKPRRTKSASIVVSKPSTPLPGNTVDTVNDAPPSQTAKTTWWTSVTGFFGPSKTAKTTSWNLSDNAFSVLCVLAVLFVSKVGDEVADYKHAQRKTKLEK